MSDWMIYQLFIIKYLFRVLTGDDFWRGLVKKWKLYNFNVMIFLPFSTRKMIIMQSTIVDNGCNNIDNTTYIVLVNFWNLFIREVWGTNKFYTKGPSINDVTPFFKFYDPLCPPVSSDRLWPYNTMRRHHFLKLMTTLLHLLWYVPFLLF